MHTYSATPGRRCRDRRGFTIIEATITIGIIALLSAIVIYAVGKVRGQGDIIAERAMVTTLQKAVERFKQEYGFLPALVIDTPMGSTNPVTTSNGQIQVWKTSDLFDPNTTLNGSNSGDRRCYSIHSLPYYLAGALDVSYDGGAGLTFTAPQSDGQFSKRGRAHEAMVELTQQKTRLGATRLYVSNATSVTASQRVDCRIWDRWSVGSSSGASYEIRYYRWLSNFVTSGAGVGEIDYYNCPMALDPTFINSSRSDRVANPIMFPPPKPEFRTAEYAIVSAGPNHAFGDEPIATLAQIMEVAVPSTIPEISQLRARAAADNIVEVGR